MRAAVFNEGQLVVNGVDEALNAARAGMGLGFVPEDLARPYVAKGELKRVLDDWCAPFPGFHLYYPSRHHASPAFGLLVDALRYRAVSTGSTPVPVRAHRENSR
jgi:DNA-binding transcriptional LysR family regulator